MPDRVLHEPREGPRKPPVELPGVDLSGDRPDDFGAAAGLVAGEAVGMVGSKPAQNAGPVQEIMHERIDRNHAAAGLTPAAPRTWRAKKQLRQRHHQHFVGNAVDLFQRLDQRRSHSGRPVGPGLLGGSIQPSVEPADEVTVGNVTHEQVQ